MIVNVPFTYEALAILGRKRNPDKLRLAGSVACSVREASADEAPVVLWWQGSPGHPQECVRHFEGRLYAPVINGGGYNNSANPDIPAPRGAGVARRWGAPDPHEGPDEQDGLDADEDGDAPTLSPGVGQLVSAAGYVARLSRGASADGGGYRAVPLADGAKPATHVLDADGIVRPVDRHAGAPEPLKRMVADGREREAAGIAAQAARLLSVGGVLFAEVGRPTYVLRLFRSDLPEMHRSFGERGSPSVHEHPFPVEDYGRMADLHRETYCRGSHAAQRAEAYDSGAYVPNRLPPPDIERPDLLPEVDANEMQLRSTSAALVAHLAHMDNGSYGSGRVPLFTRYPRDLILSYGRLRDAVEARAPLPEVVDAMAAVRAAAEPHGTLGSVVECARLACGRAEAAFSDSLALGAI